MKIIESIKNYARRALGVNTPGLLARFVWGDDKDIRVTEYNALQLSTVYQCVRVIADTVASLPIFLYRRLGSGKDRATEHPLYRVLHEEPNPYMTPFEFKQTLQGHLCLWGNAFADIERNGAGNVVALWPLRPDNMRLQIFNGKIFYYYTKPNGGEIQLTDVFHLRGLSSDGIIGYSPIDLASDTLGLSKGAEDYRSRFFQNDARPGGILKHPNKLGEEAHKRLKKGWEDSHQGLDNVNRVAILEEGMTWQDVGVPPDNAQFIQGQEFQKADIAAIFRVPSYKIGLLKPGTVSYASVEQQAIDFVVDCIRPWLICWEERTTLALLTPSERRDYFAEFLLDALLRGDSAQRGAFYSQLWNIGVLSQNDILGMENRNGLGPIGDRRYVPLNMVPVDKIDELLLAKQQPSLPGDEAEPEPKPAQLNGVKH